jgi:hypothetical protein
MDAERLSAPLTADCLGTFKELPGCGGEVMTGLPACDDGTGRGRWQEFDFHEIAAVFEHHVRQYRNAQIGSHEVLYGFSLFALKLYGGLEAGLAAELYRELTRAVARVLIHDEFLVRELRDGDAGFLGERVIAGNRQAQILTKELARFQAGRLQREERYAQVDFAVLDQRNEVGGAILFAQRDDDTWEFRPERTEHGGQEVRRYGRQNAHPDNASHTALYVEHSGARLLHFRKNSFGVGNQNLTGAGEADLSAGALEKSDAEVGFEPLDLYAECGLGFGKLRGGAPKTPGLHDGEEAFELCNGHVSAGREGSGSDP